MRRGYHGDSDWAHGGHARCPDLPITEAGVLRMAPGPQRLFGRHATRAASTGMEAAQGTGGDVRNATAVRVVKQENGCCGPRYSYHAWRPRRVVCA